MEWLSKDTKKLLFEMSVGVILYNVICCLIGFFLMVYLGRPPLPVAGGILAGMVAAIVMLIHMAITTERVLESRSETYANKNTVLHSMIRKVLYAAAVIVLWRIVGLDFLAMIVGTFGIKIGAYLQPAVHKFFERSSKLS